MFLLISVREATTVPSAGRRCEVTPQFFYLYIKQKDRDLFCLLRRVRLMGGADTPAMPRFCLKMSLLTGFNSYRVNAWAFLTK